MDRLTSDFPSVIEEEIEGLDVEKQRDNKCYASLEAAQVFYAWKHSDVVGYNGVEIDGRLPIELKVEVGKKRNP